MTKRILTFFLSALLILGLFAGCNNGGGENTPSTPIGPEIKKPENMLVKGQSLKLQADKLPSGAQITWVSSDPSRAIVDSSGTVVALSNRGEVTITASAGGKTQSFTVGLCQQTGFGPVNLPSNDENVIIAVWNGSYHNFNLKDMEMLSEAGIDQIIGVDARWIGSKGIETVLDHADEYGIGVILDLRQWDGGEVPAYVTHPAVDGVLLYDEPCATQFQGLMELKSKFEEAVPDGPAVYVNIFSEACSYESLFGESYDSEKVDYETYYLNYFMETVKPGCLSYDAYALQEGGLIRQSYYHNFDVAAHRAKQDGVPFWYTLLSSGHSTTDGRYVTPTEKEFRWQMAMGMTYGTTQLAHYIYTTHDEDYEPLVEYGTWKPTQLFNDMKTVNLEVQAWEDIYRSFTWKGTAKVDSGEKNTMLDSLEYDLSFTQTGMLTGVASDGDLLVGTFEAENGMNGYMITNAGDTSPCDQWLRLNFTMEDASVKLQLSEGKYLCVAVINKGEVSYIPVNADNTVELTVEAYNGVFVIPVL